MVAKLSFCIFLSMLIVGCNSSKYDDSAKNLAKKKDNHLEENTFIAKIPNSLDVGNSSIMTGVLNERDGCLYINDYFVVLQNDSITVNQKPFYIINTKNKSFNLNSNITTGGWASDFIHLKNLQNSEWLKSIPSKCQVDKVWFVSTID